MSLRMALGSGAARRTGCRQVEGDGPPSSAVLCRQLPAGQADTLTPGSDGPLTRVLESWSHLLRQVTLCCPQARACWPSLKSPPLAPGWPGPKGSVRLPPGVSRSPAQVHHTQTLVSEVKSSLHRRQPAASDLSVHRLGAT